MTQHSAAASETTDSTPAAHAKAPSNSYVFAVVKTSEGAITILKAKQRTDLGKLLSQLSPDHEVIGVFKGKQLTITEKKSFNFS